MRTVLLNGEELGLEDLWEIAFGRVRVALAEEARVRLARRRREVEGLLARGETIYGVNTGFGHLRDRRIPPDALRQLQRNLIRSHASGVGDPLPVPVVRAMMAIRAASLARGHSGVRPEAVEALLALLNAGIHPWVPAQGSVGASGDLAPLAHVALALLGEGYATRDPLPLPVEGWRRPPRLEDRRPAADLLAAAGLPPFVPEAKEGLALINGTDLMVALGGLGAVLARHTLDLADRTAALTFEALGGKTEPLDPRLHALRPHPGIRARAAHLRQLLEGSGLIWDPTLDPPKVQDAYALRCTPVVHGSVEQALDSLIEAVRVELRSVTDNPLLVAEGDGWTFLAGGNFHGEPLALPLDHLALALTELGAIAERRLARLVDPGANGGLLPPFLAREPGLQSGLMIVQYAAAALVSECKALCHPASADSIPTSAGTEDHVSMGPIAGRKAWQILANVRRILAGEALAAARGIAWRQEREGRGPLGRGTAPFYARLQEVVPIAWEDAPPAWALEALEAAWDRELEAGLPALP